MPGEPVVVNNTPLVALFTLGRLGLLGDLFGEVLVPAAVIDELLAVDRDARRAALDRCPSIRSATVQEPRRALSYTGLDRGESEVLALADERSARLVVVDERRARRLARRMGFGLTGTLGLLLLAKDRGLLDTVAEPLAALQAAGLHIHPDLATRVLELAGEAGED